MSSVKDSFIPVAIAFGAAALKPEVRFIDQKLQSTTDKSLAIKPDDAMDMLAVKLEELLGRPYETAAELEAVKVVWNITKEQVNRYVLLHAAANYPTSLYITMDLMHLLEARVKKMESTGKIEVIPKEPIAAKLLGKFAAARNALFIARAALREKCRQLFAAATKESQMRWLRTKGADISPIALESSSLIETYQDRALQDPQVDDTMCLESIMLTTLAYKVRDKIQKSGVSKAGALEGFLYSLANSKEDESRKDYLIKWLELAETDFDEREGLKRWEFLSKEYLQKYLDTTTGFTQVDSVIRVARELFYHDILPISDHLGVNISAFHKSLTSDQYSKVLTLCGQKSSAFFGRYALDIAKKSKLNREAELAFYDSISSKITDAINKSGKKKIGLLKEFGGLGFTKVSLPPELQDIGLQSLKKNIDDSIEMSDKAAAGRIRTLYGAAIVSQKLSQLALNPEKTPKKTRKASKVNRSKKGTATVCKVLSVEASAAPVSRSAVNTKPASGKAIVESPICELPSKLHLHDRVVRWFNPSEDTDPFRVDPMYMSNSYSDTAKRKIRLEHNFGLAVDSLLPDFGLEDGNKNKFLIAEIEAGGERWMCILLYCFTKNGVCFHRYAHRKSAKEVLVTNIKFAQEGIMELEYPKIGELRSVKEHLKKSLSDGSYIEKKSENITTVIDPKNDAIIRVWTKKEEG